MTEPVSTVAFAGAMKIRGPTTCCGGAFRQRRRPSAATRKPLAAAKN